MHESSRYRFHSIWLVCADKQSVFDTLADYTTYPTWWPQVRSTAADGEGVRTECRSFLPYSLSFTMYDGGQQAHSGILVGRMEGDIEGSARWTVTPSAHGCARIVYDQTVTLTEPLLRRVGMVGRPAFRANHAWMMRAGQKGLRRKLEV